MANKNYTKVDINQLNTLSKAIDSTTTSVASNLEDYKNNLSAIVSSQFLEGVSVEAINESYDKIMAIFNKFSEYSTEIIKEINDVSTNTQEIDQQAAQTNEDIMCADPLSFGLLGAAIGAGKEFLSNIVDGVNDFNIDLPNVDSPDLNGSSTNHNFTGTKGEVADYLIEDMGLNKAATAAVMANIEKESGFNPNTYGDNGTSYGICQWHNSRFPALKNYCNKNGYDYTTTEGQMHYLEYELKNSYPSVYQKLQSVPDTKDGAYEAAYYYCVKFEVPANASQRGSERGNAAIDYYEQM